jgi:hypothetical protein
MTFQWRSCHPESCPKDRIRDDFLNDLKAWIRVLTWKMSFWFQNSVLEPERKDPSLGMEFIFRRRFWFHPSGYQVLLGNQRKKMGIRQNTQLQYLRRPIPHQAAILFWRHYSAVSPFRIRYRYFEQNARCRLHSLIVWLNFLCLFILHLLVSHGSFRMYH